MQGEFRRDGGTLALTDGAMKASINFDGDQATSNFSATTSTAGRRDAVHASAVDGGQDRFRALFGDAAVTLTGGLPERGTTIVVRRRRQYVAKKLAAFSGL